MDEIAAGIDRLGQPFEYIMSHLDLPPEVNEIGAHACLAEEAMHGQQVATEGYVHNGNVVVYGALDSLNYPGTPSFLRHQYPSQLPGPVVRRMREVSIAVIEQVGLDNVTFSIEFFCDTDSGDVRLLEINPRHSQSHAELFEYVDGVPNHYCMLSVALGRDPGLPSARDPTRSPRSGTTAGSPTPSSPGHRPRTRSRRCAMTYPVCSSTSRHPREHGFLPCRNRTATATNSRTSTSGADSEAELERKYDQTIAALPFEFSTAAS